MLGWPRVRVALVLAVVVLVLFTHGWTTGPWSLFSRALALGLAALLVFGLFEQWPRRLPRWLARWALQVIAVGLAMPITTAVIT